MQYMGSKNKIAKHILPIMLEERKDGQFWIEPFVGGANMIDKVDGNRIGGDSHKYLIALLSKVQSGWIPPTEVSREMYYDIKGNKESYPDEVVGFVGFLCSFGGRWLGGYASNRLARNYADVASRALTKQSSRLKGIEFRCCEYTNLDIPSNSIIYCDPPYANTKKYKHNIDHNHFWNWCRDMDKAGHTVFVSEYNAPEDFECIKEIQHTTSMNKNKKQMRIEKLFRYRRA